MYYLSSLGGVKQKSIFTVMKCISEWKRIKIFNKIGLASLHVLQPPTEQMVLSCLAFVMILLEAEKVAKICRNQSPGAEI